MLRYLATIAYVGTHYQGWQSQKHTNKTVQATIEQAIFRLTKSRVVLFASGRTDVGVHALNQTAHFDLDTNIAIVKLKSGINHFLPCDVIISDIVVVPSDFHARYSVVSKTYQYIVATKTNPLLNMQVAFITGQLNIQDMIDAAKLLIGKKDFSAYMSSGSSIKSTVRTIFSCEVQKITHQITCDELYIFTIKADGFLYNMVRIIVAHLLRIGQGKDSIASVNNALSANNRQYTKAIAPACGLYLKAVEY